MNILIIGLGSIGQRHLRNLSKLKFPKKIFVLRKKFQTPTLDNNLRIIKQNIKIKHNLTYISSLKNISKLKIDFAIICTPTSQHIEQSIELLKNKINILVEKPIGSNLKKINKLQKILLKRKEIKTMMGYQLKFNPIINKIDYFLKKKSIGNIYSVESRNGENLKTFHPYENFKTSYASQKKLGGGVVLTQSHDLDILMYLFKDYKIKKIKSINEKVTDFKIDVEDISMSILEFRKKRNKKFLCKLFLNYFEKPPSREINIIGSKGKICADLIRNTIQIFRKNNFRIYKYKFKKNDIFIKELKYFINCVKKNKQVDEYMNLKQGIEVLKYSLKILKN